jgi:hypothetical protein
MINIASLARLAFGVALIAGTTALVGCGPEPYSRTTTTQQSTTTTPVVQPSTTTTTTTQQNTQRP